jgi:hypothetical protein
LLCSCFAVNENILKRKMRLEKGGNIMRVIIFSTMLILMGCLIGGCSTANHVTTQTIRNDEPFMAEIKKIATKREGFYFLGQPIDEAEIECRKADLNEQQDFSLRTSGARELLVGIPVLMVRF